MALRQLLKCRPLPCAPRVTKRVPEAILGLVAGVGAYFLLGLTDPALFVLDGNPLVIGALVNGGGSFVDALAGRWQSVMEIGVAQIQQIAVLALRSRHG